EGGAAVGGTIDAVDGAVGVRVGAGVIVVGHAERDVEHGGIGHRVDHHVGGGHQRIGHRGGAAGKLAAVGDVVDARGRAAMQGGGAEVDQTGGRVERALVQAAVARRENRERAARVHCDATHRAL